ncbi:MAG: adenylate kinase [Verrucomicrobiota bacterium]
MSLEKPKKGLHLCPGNAYKNDSVSDEENHAVLIGTVMSDSLKHLKANRVFLLIGAPGSGKGTQAEALCDFFNMHHVATGDLFREHLKRGSELGKLARTYIERGGLVPDSVTDEMLKQRLQQGDNCIGFLLDGFPRTLAQAEALNAILKELEMQLCAVLNIQVSDEEIVQRLAERFICRHCQTPYNLSAKPPRQTGICDICGDELYQRSDDRPETVRARLATFHQQTEPLLAFYRQAGLLQVVEGKIGMHNVTRAFARIIAEKIC